MLTLLALTAPLALPSLLSQPQHPDAPRPVAWTVQSEARPWMGVSLAGEGDLEVVDVHAGSPAERAGVRVGDRLVAVGKQKLASYGELSEALGVKRPGDEVAVAVERPVLANLSEEHTTDDGRPLLGIYLDGNRITSASEGHPAAEAGLKKGDRIVAIAEHRTASSGEIVEALGSVGAGPVDLVIVRRLDVTLDARPGESVAEPEVADGWAQLFPEVEEHAEEPFEWHSDEHAEGQWLVVPNEPGDWPQGLFMPGQQQSHEELRAELRTLTEELATLRAEIAALREMLAELQGGGR